MLAFCDWLAGLPADQPFDVRPEFAFFSDLTTDELEAAEIELVRRYSALAGDQRLSDFASDTSMSSSAANDRV